MNDSNFLLSLHFFSQFGRNTNNIETFTAKNFFNVTKSKLQSLQPKMSSDNLSFCKFYWHKYNYILLAKVKKL